MDRIRIKGGRQLKGEIRISGSKNASLLSISLLALLLSVMPAERAFSLDRMRHPSMPAIVPRWNVLLLRVQLFIVYFYGAIAKLNPDWLRGEPMYSEIVRHAPDVPPIAYHLPPALLAYAHRLRRHRCSMPPCRCCSASAARGCSASSRRRSFICSTRSS